MYAHDFNENDDINTVLWLRKNKFYRFVYEFENKFQFYTDNCAIKTFNVNRSSN